MSSLKFFLFGPPRFTIDDQALDLSLRKAQALLVYLAVSRRPHSRDALSTLLWPESGQSTARANLRRTLYRLNKHLVDDVLVVTPDTVAFDPHADLWLDTAAFQEAAAPFASMDAAQLLSDAEAAQLEAVVTLYSDDFLAGFTLSDCPRFDDWQFFQREELRRLLMNVLKALVLFYEQREDWGEAIGYARRWLALDPLHEPVHRLLMRLYARNGHQAAALRQYEECQQVLSEELDVRPDEETEQLYEAIRSRRFARQETNWTQPSGAAGTDSWAVERRERAIRPPHHHLPTQPTPFVGREQEVAILLRRLREPACRLLTLVGPGGIGKTRLAVESARRMADDESFADGVCVVSLASVHSGTGIVPAIAEAVGFAFQDSLPPEQQLLHYLQGKRMLLVLDNVEHLVDDVAFVAQLLAAVPSVKVLATSRQALNLQSEWFHAVGGMLVPGEDETRDRSLVQYDAIRFFVQCALRAQCDFSFSASEVEIVRICRLVEGMPLAIELAATWLKVLSPAQIADELARNLDILTSRYRNMPERHHSMRAVIEQSWDLLSAQEQATLRRLAVFRGGFGLQAAAQVAGATLPTLAGLVEKSWLSVHEQERYQIHELLRQFAQEKLADAGNEQVRARQAHCAFYAHFLHEREADLCGGRQRFIIAEIAEEYENARSAWLWAAQHVLAKELEMAETTLDLFHYFQSLYREGRDLLAQARDHLVQQERTEAADRALALVLAGLSWYLMRLNQLDEAETAIDQCQAIYRRRAMPPVAGYGTDPVLALSMLHSLRGNHVEADRHLEHALQASQAYDHALNRQVTHNLWADVKLHLGELAAAEQHAQAAFDLAQERDDRWMMADCLVQFGHIARIRQDYAAAQRHFQASYDMWKTFDNLRGMARALDNLGDLAQRQTLYTRAEKLHRQSLEIYCAIADRYGTASALTRLGHVAVSTSAYEEARDWLRQALQTAAEIEAYTLVSNVLFAVARLYLQLDQIGPGVELLALVRSLAATEDEPREQAQQLLDWSRSRIAQEDYDRAFQCGETADLSDVTAACLADLVHSAAVDERTLAGDW